MKMRPPTHIRLLLLGLAVALLCLIADQYSKERVLSYFSGGNQEIAVTSFFNIVMVWNYGVSFGLFAEHNQPLILVTISSVILLILFIWLYKNNALTVSIAIGMVIGGAIGNIIDRLRFGAVADFLDFHVAGYHWPAFNIADSCIFIGVVLLCAHSMFTEFHHSRKRAP